MERLKHIMAQAGDMAMGYWPGAGHAVESWDKGGNDPVSAADLKIDGFLKQELGALLPAAGWLSEETIDDPARLKKGLIWLVDPIDGTRDFLRGRRGWAVSVALICEGKPLLGLLEAPAWGADMSLGSGSQGTGPQGTGPQGTGSQGSGPQASGGRSAYCGSRYFAEAGKGAFCDRGQGEEPLSASQCRQFAGARIPADALPKQDQMLVKVEKPNSIALRMAMVAENRADVLATLRWGFEWDLGAAGLIAREAGAEVSDAFGASFAYNKRDPRAFGLLVSAPAIHADAVQHLAARAERLRAI